MTQDASEPLRSDGCDLFRWAFEVARDMIMLHDPGLEPTHAGPFIEVNDAARSTSGYSRDELLAMTLADLVLQRDVDLLAKHLERVAEWGQATTELGLVSQQGHELAVELCSHRVGIESSAVIVSVARDTSERRRLERVKSDFMSTISHELRTPLAVIIGYGALLLRPDAVLDREKRLEILRKLIDRAELLGGVVEELLLVSHLQMEDAQLEVAQEDVGELLERCVALARPTERHRLEVGVSTPPLLAYVDSGKLAHAISALLSNAIKFSPEGGLVTLEARRRAREIRITISDHGVGMSASDVPAAFDQFAQTDMTATRPFGGFGLGLFVARHLVEAHGGRIEVDTTLGAGSTFTLVIPDTDQVPGPA
jgi:PAS domain S-box-containing protein